MINKLERGQKVWVNFSYGDLPALPQECEIVGAGIRISVAECDFGRYSVPNTDLHHSESAALSAMIDRCADRMADHCFTISLLAELRIMAQNRLGELEK